MGSVLTSARESLEQLYDAVSSDINAAGLAAIARETLEDADGLEVAAPPPAGYAVLRKMVRSWKTRDDLAPGEIAGLYFARAVLAVCENDLTRAFERAQMAWGWAPMRSARWAGPSYADFGL